MGSQVRPASSLFNTRLRNRLRGPLLINESRPVNGKDESAPLFPMFAAIAGAQDDAAIGGGNPYVLVGKRNR